MKYEDFWNKFTLLELEHDLLNLRVDGFQLYALRRVKVFYAVVVALGLYSNPHPRKSEKAAQPGPVNEDFQNIPESSTVVIPFRRLVQGIDPYSQTIFESLKSAGTCSTMLDWSWLSGIQREARLEARKSLDNQSVSETVSQGAAYKWSKVVSLFEEEFSVSLPGLVLPMFFLAELRAKVLALSRYFRDAKVQNLYIVDAYSNQWIVLAAHDAGVKVHDIQHGFISRFHPAYSYPHGSPKLDHVPVEVMVWGKFWTNNVALPSGVQFKVSGATKDLNEGRKKSDYVCRKAKQVLFTSQGAVSDELHEAALAVALSLPEFNVIYRLHPNEDLASYPRTDLPDNFSYSHETPVLLELILESTYLVGVFSTTLYEGMALGAKVLILPLAGFENMKLAIENGDATLLSDLGRVREIFREAKQAQNIDKYYARENKV